MPELQLIHNPIDVASGNGYTNGGTKDPANSRSQSRANGQTHGVAVGVSEANDEIVYAAATGQVNATANGKQNPHNGTPYHGGPTDGLPISAQHMEAMPQPAEADQLMLLAGEELVELTTVLESLLFVAGEAVPAANLAKSLRLKEAQVEVGLQLLATRYKERGSGLRLQAHNGRYQLVTAPPAATFVEDFLNIDVSTKLSRAALESLAIIAYRQPVTRVQVEAVRGVDCSGVLRSLTARGLIEELGRQDVVGRPILYGVTELFMQHFGITELGELPPLGEDDADLLHAATELTVEDASEGNVPNAARAN